MILITHFTLEEETSYQRDDTPFHSLIVTSRKWGNDKNDGTRSMMNITFSNDNFTIGFSNNITLKYSLSVKSYKFEREDSRRLLRGPFHTSSQ